jgi:hypothetical protein
METSPSQAQALRGRNYHDAHRSILSQPPQSTRARPCRGVVSILLICIPRRDTTRLDLRREYSRTPTEYSTRATPTAVEIEFLYLYSQQ